MPGVHIRRNTVCISTLIRYRLLLMSSFRTKYWSRFKFLVLIKRSHILKQTCSFLMICSSNHMFGRAIWNKLPGCSFGNLKIAPVKRGQFSKCSKIASLIYPKNCPSQTSDYWLITQSQQTLCIETNIL